MPQPASGKDRGRSAQTVDRGERHGAAVVHRGEPDAAWRGIGKSEGRGRRNGQCERCRHRDDGVIAVARGGIAERSRDVVGGAHFFGADAAFVEKTGDRRSLELEDGGAGAADRAAVAGAAFGLAQRALETRERPLLGGGRRVCRVGAGRGAAVPLGVLR